MRKWCAARPSGVSSALTCLHSIQRFSRSHWLFGCRAGLRPGRGADKAQRRQFDRWLLEWSESAKAVLEIATQQLERRKISASTNEEPRDGYHHLTKGPIKWDKTMKQLIARASVQINAPAARVWDVLTQTEFTRQYMFGCEAVSDWKVGSPLLWKGMQNDRQIVFVKGTILRIEPEKALAYTTFDPNAGLEDVPDNYVTASYHLTPNRDGVLLEVSQGDFAKCAHCEKRYSETAAAWPIVLQKVKALAEHTE